VSPSLPSSSCHWRLLLPRLLLVAAALWPCSFATAADRAPEEVRAQLTPRRYATLASEVGAKVHQVLRQEGQAFAAGDLLVAFDSALPRAQVARAQAILLAAEKTHAAQHRLFGLKSIGQVDLDLAEIEVTKARAELDYASAMLARCEVRAPYAGRVAEQRVREQEFVQPGQPLLEIIDDATPQIDFIAPSRWLAWLRVGQPLRIQIDETGRTYAAVVERIGARVDPVSQSVRVIAVFPEPPPDLVAGMSGSVVVTPSPAP
jgi:membrane fusion protein, multidrug efflux system